MVSKHSCSLLEMPQQTTEFESYIEVVRMSLQVMKSSHRKLKYAENDHRPHESDSIMAD